MGEESSRSQGHIPDLPLPLPAPVATGTIHTTAPVPGSPQQPSPGGSTPSARSANYTAPSSPPPAPPPATSSALPAPLTTPHPLTLKPTPRPRSPRQPRSPRFTSPHRSTPPTTPPYPLGPPVNTYSLTRMSSPVTSLCYSTSTHNRALDSTATAVVVPATSPPHVHVGDLIVTQPPIDADDAPPRIFTYANYVLTTTVMVTAVLFIFTSGILQAVIYAKDSGNLAALVSVFLAPVTATFMLFPSWVVVAGVLFYLFGPLVAVKTNNQTYSVLRSPPPKGEPLPIVVVMMPVYKEDLEEVIVPTYESLKISMDHYTAMGGTTWWLICDDGYTLLSRDKAMKRLEFYAEKNITFVGRPPHSEKNPRRGLFKKASNMNYTLILGDLVKEMMAADPDMAPRQALQQIWEERGKEFKSGGDGIIIPDDAVVLLIDADTRVPATCIYDTMGEFMRCPEVAYTQHFTTPFEDQNTNYFECMLSFFTKKIYLNGFVVPCSMGACAPLVGHNAFLRYSSIKAAAFECPAEGTTKYWSEDTVSEDFDIFMRLAQKNMWGRLVAYTGEEFREGVSLTYQDELIKFRKFAYGCCEMMFNRFKDWPRRGPLTPMFKGFLTSKFIPWPQKVNMIAYLGTYLAMGAAFYTTFFEGFASVFMPDLFDHFGTRAFDVTLTCFFVFGVIGTACSIMFRLRVRYISAQGVPPKYTLYELLMEEVAYIPLMTLFFGSILFHLTTACFCYFFNLNLVWGSSVKERVEGTSAWSALRQTVEAYWTMYATMSISLGVYIIAAWYYEVGMYRGWNIYGYAIAHLVGPILLNPDIMSMGLTLSRGK